MRRLLVHAAHVRGRSSRSRGFRQVSDKALGGQDHRGDAGSVLQSGTSDLGRVDDTGLDHILDVLLLLGIKAVVGLVGLQDVVDNDAALEASVGSDLAQRSLQRFADDLRTGALVALQLADQLVDSGDGVDGGRAAASDDAFLNSGLGRVQGILDAAASCPSSRPR